MNATTKHDESLPRSTVRQWAKALLPGYFSSSGTSGFKAPNASDRDADLCVGDSPFDHDPLRVTADEVLSAVALAATFVILMWLLREVGGLVFA